MADAGIIGPDAGKSLQLYPRIGVDTRSAATDPDLATDLHWNAVIALTCGQIYLWNVVSACAKTQGDQRCFFQLDIEPQVPYPEGFPVFRPHVTILYKRTSSIADRDWNRFLIKAKVLLSVGPFECKLYVYTAGRNGPLTIVKCMASWSCYDERSLKKEECCMMIR